MRCVSAPEDVAHMAVAMEAQALEVTSGRPALWQALKQIPRQAGVRRQENGGYKVMLQQELHAVGGERVHVQCAAVTKGLLPANEVDAAQRTADGQQMVQIIEVGRTAALAGI